MPSLFAKKALTNWRHYDKIAEKRKEETNSYLIDEKDKIKSQMSKESIEDLIKKNYIQLVRIKEENRKWEENLNL